MQTINAANARNYGGELELEGKITPQFSVNLNASYLNAQFTKFCNAYYGAAFPARSGISYPVCPTDSGLVDLSGKRLPNAPRFTVGGGFNWDIPLGNDSRLAVNGDIKWQSKVYFTEFNNRDAEQGSYAMANAGLTWHAPGDRFSIGGWVKNITNEFVIAKQTSSLPPRSPMSASARSCRRAPTG